MSAPGRSAPQRAFDGLARSAMRVGFRCMRVWWRLRHPTLRGVYVAVHHGGELLMIRNSYHAACSFPSGRRGRREDPAAAAARELWEEVGVAAEPAALRLVAEVLNETPLADDHVHVFELWLDERPALQIDHREVVWAAFEPAGRARERELLPIVRRYLDGTLDEIRISPPSAE